MDPQDPTEDVVDETGRNPTQARIDEEGPDDRLVDVAWETEGGPRERDAGQVDDVA